MEIMVGVLFGWIGFSIPREVALALMRRGFDRQKLSLPPLWRRVLGGPIYGEAWLSRLDERMIRANEDMKSLYRKGS